MMTAARQPDPVDVDIDPGWYPGQPELFDDAGTPGEDGQAEPQQQGMQAAGASTSNSVAPVLRPLASSSVPTVLTKLQKWGDYASVGAQVLPTKFIPMKTPLSAEILDSWSLPSQPKHRLTVPEMVAQQAALGRKVGLLLDLSNHDCLYTADIPPDVSYLHIQLVAKELPPQDFVDAVVSAANEFWSTNPDEYIAIHCAYGFNRTGFVVCCYLIEVCGLSVEDALAAFAASRPPGVKHEQFRKELHRRYGSGVAPASLFGVCGSPPDENSSFGCSPSCGSLDLRDLSSGASPVPLLRGNTFGAMLGACGASPVVSRLSLENAATHHQTLTFTSSSVPTDCQLDGSGGGAGQQLQQHPWQQHMRAARHAVPNGLACTGRPSEEAREEERQAGQPSMQAALTTGASPGSCGAPIGAPSTSCRQDSSDGSAGVQQRQPQQQSYNENESLGVNDRFILQTLRQHALAQANGTIPEESASSQSTPLRGCSSNSLADSGNPTGNSTPAAGRYSRPSLEGIDWSAATAVAEGSESSGQGLEGLASCVAGLKLS